MILECNETEERAALNDSTTRRERAVIIVSTELDERAGKRRSLRSEP
jgi:hypothetical protein